MLYQNPEEAKRHSLGDPGQGRPLHGFTYDDESIHYPVISVNVNESSRTTKGDKDVNPANGLQNLVAEVSQYCREQNVIMTLFYRRVPPNSDAFMEPTSRKPACQWFELWRQQP